jgi:hypothetical protein
MAGPQRLVPSKLRGIETSDVKSSAEIRCKASEMHSLTFLGARRRRSIARQDRLIRVRGRSTHARPLPACRYSTFVNA